MKHYLSPPFSSEIPLDNDLLKRLQKSMDPPMVSSSDSSLRNAAVLLPLQPSSDGWTLYFIRRSQHVIIHSGQTAFPGGAMEPQDPSPQAAALREAQEEIGLPSNNVRVLGLLRPIQTITQYLVYPVVSRILQPWKILLNPYEVDELFRIPLSAFLNPQNHAWETRSWDNQTFPVHVFRYQRYQIWGATGRILALFLGEIARLYDLDLSWLNEPNGIL